MGIRTSLILWVKAVGLYPWSIGMFRGMMDLQMWGLPQMFFLPPLLPLQPPSPMGL